MGQLQNTTVTDLGTNSLSPNISEKTTKGIFWSFFGHGFNKGFSFLSLAILAHLLTQEAFGLVAATAIVLNFLIVYKDFGLGNALIQYSGDLRRASSTVFFLNLLLGFFLSTVVYLIAPSVSSYFDNPVITPILRCLSISFTITSVGSIHDILLKKALNYRKKCFVDMGGALIKGFVSIVMALNGYGVWSIIIGQLCGQIVVVCLLWLSVPWRPELIIDVDIAKKLLKFGASIVGTGTITTLTENLAFIVAGKMCGMTMLGVFSLAYRLPEMLLLGNLWVLSGVFFAMFSIIQHHPVKLRQSFLMTIRVVSMYATPQCFILIFAADPIIRVFYGEQWLEAIPVLQILALYAWVHSFGFHAGDVYKAIGKPNVLLYLSLLAVIIDLSALLLGSRYGLVGISTGLLGGMIINSVINIFVAKKLIKVSIRKIIKELKPSMAAGAVFLIVSVTMTLISKGYHPIYKLILLTVPGAVGYAYVLWKFDKDKIISILSSFKCLKWLVEKLEG
ncbi:MAG: lipopolysaccharide biosynthesis protein [Desulfotalea sp.]